MFVVKVEIIQVLYFVKKDVLVYYRQEKNLKRKHVLIKDVNTLIMIIPYIMQENIFVDFIYNLSVKKKS